MSNSDRQTVSILTTSFNHRRWIGATIESVAMQSYRALEHVIVDDGSADDSVDIIRFAADESNGRIKWLRQMNLGQAAALNRAFALSTGDVLGWLSSDDVYFSRHTVAWAMDAFRANPTAVAVYGHSVLINAAGQILRTTWAPPDSRFAWSALRFMCSQPTLFVRRSAISGSFVAPGFDVAMDTELIFRLHRIGPFVRVPHILAGERHHVGRKSYNSGIRSASKVIEDSQLRKLGVFDGSRTRRLQIRLSKCIYRYAGIGLLIEARRGGTVVDPGLKGAVSLFARQVFVRRSAMQ